MSRIIPGIFEKNIKQFKQKYDILSLFADYVHIDIASESFVDNSTFKLRELNTDILDKADYEIHIMVENPIELLQSELKIKPAKIILHIETLETYTKKQIIDFIESDKMANIEIALAINHESYPSLLDKYFKSLNKYINSFMFMTVEPGGSGRHFIKSVLNSIKKFHYINHKSKINIDGGVNEETIKIARDSCFCIDKFVVTSCISKADNPKEVYNHLNEIVNEYEK